MLPAEDLFAYVHALIHDLVLARAIAVPARPGPPPACTDAELLAIAVVRHLLGRRSEAGLGFNGRALAAELAARGTAVLVPPDKKQAPPCRPPC
jgi:hypothetical protein